MAHYRIRLIGRDERACRFIELDFPSDDAAIGVLRSHVRGPAMELWEGERLVAHFETTRPQDAPATTLAV